MATERLLQMSERAHALTNLASNRLVAEIQIFSIRTDSLCGLLFLEALPEFHEFMRFPFLESYT